MLFMFLTISIMMRGRKMHNLFRLFFAIILIILLPISEVTVNSSQLDESIHSGSFYTDKYENLFLTLLGLNQFDVNEKINNAYNQLFYGDDANQRVYYPVHPDMAYIKDILHNDVRSDGMSYGMMIAVQLNRQEEFNRLWNWAKTYMQHKDEQSKDYFAWQCKTDGTIIGLSTASDGEEWFITSLFLASNRWGDGEGIYNYRLEAQKILDAMLNKIPESDNHDDITNMFNRDAKMVVFVPNGSADDFTDPSYHVPHFYELWAIWADKNNDFWKTCAERSRQFLKSNVHPETGLASNYAKFNGTPYKAPWGGRQNDFGYDAWIVAMNIAIDYTWFAKDKWEIEQSNRLLRFFYSQGIDTYGHLYTVDGQVLAKDHRTGLVAVNAVAALSANIEQRKEFVEALWNIKVPDGIERYYDGMLYLLAMLQVSGNFKIYKDRFNPVQDIEKLQIKNLNTFDK